MRTSTRPAPASPLPAPPGLAAPLVLAGVAAALFARTLANGFVNWDDPQYILQSPFAGRGLAGLAAAWTSPHYDAYYPLTHTLYWAIDAVAGPSALAHHLVQVAIWAAGVALVPAALAAFRVPRALGFWAAVLWACHPLRVESVSWAANLKDTLSVALVLGSFALHGAGRRPCSAALFLLALLAKSVVFPVAGLFVLLEWRDGRRLREAAVRALPWLVPALAAAALGAALHLGSPDRSVPGGSLPAAIPSVLWLPWWYLGRTLLPLPTLAIHPFVPVGWLDPRLVVALLLWAGVGLFVARGRGGTTRERLLAVAAFWLPFAAVTGLVPLTFPVADRYSLLPSLAAITAALVGLGAVLARRPRSGRVAAAALGVAAVGLGAASVVRQGEWKDSVALWEADRDRDGTAIPARINLAGAYGEGGRWDDALREIETIARLSPDRPRNTADLFLAHASKERMDPLKARALFETLEAAAPGSPVLLEVAGAALRENQANAARVVLDAALRARDAAGTRALAAQAAARLGQHEVALLHAERALALDPVREDAVVSRALALADLKRYDEALAATHATLTDPRQRALLGAVRAMVLSATGREAEARELIRSLQGDLPRPPVAGR